MITSTANKHVRYIRSLRADRRLRRRERLFLLEGVRLVSTAQQAALEMPLVLYAPDQLAQTAAGQELLAWLAHRPGCYTASERVVAAAADTVTPQGVVAVAVWPDPPALPGLVLVLDAVQDPGNVGTLLRSAEAAGASQVVCLAGTADLYSPKVVRAAMGAHFSLALRGDVTWEELPALLNEPTAIYAAVGSATTPYYDVEWQGNVACIIGNETQGVSAAGLALATRQISIPMRGSAESLNAAIAGSVMLFEALRQRTLIERKLQEKV